jgi:hypothetical protein
MRAVALLAATVITGCRTFDENVGPTSKTSVSPRPSERFLEPTSNMPTQTRAVRKRATSDLECAEDKIEVEDLGKSHYRAAGCGRVAIYECSGGGTGTNLPRCERQ